MIATGAASVRPPITGLDLPGVFLLRWAGDALAFDEFLAVRAPKQIIIVGGGYISLEMAEAMTVRKLEVTIVEMAPAVMTNLDPDLGQRVGVELERNGVRLVMKQAVSSISQDGERLRIEGDGGFRQIADMILVAVGVRPETKLALAAGVASGFKGAIKVNRRMETNIRPSMCGPEIAPRLGIE